MNCARTAAHQGPALRLKLAARKSFTKTMFISDQAFLEKVSTLIEKHLGEEQFGVAELSRKLGISRTQLHRKLHALQQPSASALLRAARLRRAEALLQRTRLSVTEVAYRCGFRSAAYFAQCFREDYGVTPSQFRRR